MKAIPTAEEFLIEAGFPGHAKHGLAKKWMIEFAKLHVEAALKEVSEKKTHGMLVVPLFNEHQRDVIVNSYPLENIK